MLPEHTLALTCHPATPSSVARGVHARIARNPRGMLAVIYAIEGDLRRLRVPATLSESCRGELRMAARLWEHTCCEMFVARRGFPGYHEFNFSPSGEWALHAFERYRERNPLAVEHVRKLYPRLAVRSTPEKLEIGARIRLDRLSPAHAAAFLSIALSAVLEETDGSLSYWALRHPPGRPDFHHAEGYCLTLAPSGARPDPA